MSSSLHLKRRTLLASLAAVAASGMAFPAPAQQAGAAFRPNRTVRLISPQPAGGSTDAVIRPIALKLAELWGQPVVVDNKPGGGTLIGTLAVVQAPPDGHTLGLAINSLTINPGLRNDLPYDTLKDITPITQIGSITVALVAHSSLGVESLQEFVQLAKAKPGAISWASLGIGTGGHITGELLRKKAGIDIVHVPFSGSSSAYRDLLPGRVQAAFVVLDSAVPHIKAGTLKLLAVADHRRNKHFPQVPALNESIKGLSYEGIFGFIAPAGLPPETLKALHADIKQVLADPEIRQQLDRQSMDVLASSPAEFAAAIRSEIEHWKRAVKESGAQIS
jgi:tripartite-type tricarboxylate transporter receptor subunit TctC